MAAVGAGLFFPAQFRVQHLDGRNIYDGAAPQLMAQWDAVVGLKWGQIGGI